MTAIAHYVWDDFIPGLSLKSRIGVGSGDAGANVADNFKEVYMNRAPRRTPAKAIDPYPDGGPNPEGLSMAQPTGAADSLVPMEGAVRTYECIVRNGGQAVIQAVGTEEGTSLNALISDTNHVLLQVQSGGISYSDLDVDISSAYSESLLYYHVAIVFDCRTATKYLKAYVNGVLQGTDSMAMDVSPWSPTSFDDTLVTMATYTGVTNAGGWCELMVHDAELTADQILQRSFYMRAINAQR